MKHNKLHTLLFLSLVLISSVFAGFIKDNVKFFGQKAPGSIPARFIPDILSDNYDPHGRLTFSADDKQIFWSAFLPAGAGNMIFYSNFDGNSLSEPQNAPFAVAGDSAPSFSLDGKKIFFTSHNRLLPGEQGDPQTRIWYVDKIESGWGNPIEVRNVLDATAASAQMTVARSGNLYFSSRKEGETGPGLYWSKLTNGKYSRLQPLQGNIGSEFFNLDPYISPDESYILFSSSGRSTNAGIIDLYVSFRQKDGTWGSAMNLGDKVNSEYFERFPSVSRNGKYLFFVKSIGNQFPGEDTAYYWVDAKLVRQLGPVDLELAALKIKPKKPVPRGGTVKLMAKVSNNSDVYSSSTGLSFYLSKKKKINKKSILLGTASVDSLQAGKSKKIKLNTTIPEKTRPMGYYIIAQVDKDDMNMDPDVSNNVWMSASKLLVQ